MEEVEEQKKEDYVRRESTKDIKGGELLNQDTRKY